MSKLALSVDTTNIYFNCKKKFDRRFDYEMFLKHVTDSYGQPNRAFAYGAHIDNEGKSFISKLRHLGYEPIWKQVESFQVDGEKIYSRPNLSIAMFVDIIRIADRLDTIILGTSSADFAPCIEWIKEKGIQVIVYGARITPDIKNAASKYIEVDEGYLI